MEEKDKVFGGPGIDTVDERAALNYRPDIQEPVKHSIGNSPEDFKPDMEEEEDQNPATEIYVEIGETYDYVSDIVDRLYEELKNTIIPISDELFQKLKDAEVPINEEFDEKGIPFQLYDKAIEYPDHPTYALILEAVEQYAEDINGNNKLELYPDAKEMKMNIEELHYLLSKSLYGQILPVEQIPNTPKTSEIFFKALKEQEKKQYDAYRALTNLNNLNETIYYDFLTKAYESKDYYDALEEYNRSKRDHESFKRRINQQREMADFSGVDINMTRKLARKVEGQIEVDELLSESHISTLLKKQYEKPADYNKALAQMQAAMKMQVNKQIEDKQSQKDLLKTTGGMAMKKRAHNEVINLVNIRNDVYLNLYDMMNNMVEPTRTYAVEPFLNQVAQGMELVRSDYKTYLNEMYQIHMIDQEVRHDKISLVGEKEVAREGYWILDNLLK